MGRKAGKIALEALASLFFDEQVVLSSMARHKFNGKSKKAGIPMNKSLCTVALTFLLAACAIGGGRQFIYTTERPRLEGYTLRFAAAPNPTAPNVYITADKKIIVDQEPVRPPVGALGDRVTIFFGLEQDGPYVFPENGIEIRQHPSFCSPISRYVVRCSYNRPAPDTVYKYVIRVRPVDRGPRITDLDPTIMN